MNMADARLHGGTFSTESTEDFTRSRLQDQSYRYNNIVVENSSAIFGNIYHYHSLPPDLHLSEPSSRKRRREDEDFDESGREFKAGRREVLSSLTESLSFDGIWDRHSSLAIAHPGTCERILSDLSLEPEAQDEDNTNKREKKLAFSKWLESDANYFWIRGTAGFGKSTLINFIVQHETDVRTKLRSWAGTHDVLFASFFFWRHGQFLQKSVNGMLRSLLIQVLQQALDTIDALAINMPEDQYTARQRSTVPSSRPWTQSSLVQLLHKAIENCNSKICLFIDALDEFHAYDGQDELDSREAALQENVLILLETLKSLWQMPNVKVCLASRPGNVFDLAFANTEVLDLERLNETDIEIYVNGKLGLWVDVKMARRLSASLLVRSSGIFLWAKLAVD